MINIRFKLYNLKFKLKKFYEAITLKALIGFYMMDKYSDLKHYKCDIISAYPNIFKSKFDEKELNKLLELRKLCKKKKIINYDICLWGYGIYYD